MTLKKAERLLRKTRRVLHDKCQCDFWACQGASIKHPPEDMLTCSICRMIYEIDKYFYDKKT